MENEKLIQEAITEILGILENLPKGLANFVIFGIVSNWLKVLIVVDNERTLH